MLHPGIFKFGSLCAVSEFTNVSKTEMISKLWLRLYAVNSDAFV